ncbi:MAG: methyltransferase domain-containing protein [Chloroflexi bacterium]|nr:MAG: methyltransferase domain-containing protein [Chloroflexota bacterium]
MTIELKRVEVDSDALRAQVTEKYTEIANEPEKGAHFHTGKSLAMMVGYPEAIIDSLPAGTVESFAGTGNPFSMGELKPGETVLDLGCGAGFDSLIAARQVGASGRVISIDMTPAMLDKARVGASEAGLSNVEFHEVYAESLPVQDKSVDVVISNGVINLCPDKMAVFGEINRVLKPGGRIQLGDMVVHKAVPDDAKADIDLWRD